MEIPPDESNLHLRTLVVEQLASRPGRRMPFAEYMDLVLYHPELGYYATHAGRIGGRGDFYTAPHLGSDFGELVAVQAVEMWEVLGRPACFTFLELGAGQGLFASDFIRFARARYPEFAGALDYAIFERSRAQITEQKRLLAQHPVRWVDLEEIPPGSIVGCVFSNELVDAFAVHQFVIHQGKVLEVFVALGEDGKELVEVAARPSTDEIVQFLEGIGIEPAGLGEGYRSEVNLEAIPWMALVARVLGRGFVLTIDYGYTTNQYYAPARRHGTLQCYHRHRLHDNPYLHIGNQDITCYVNFTVLEAEGRRHGLDVIAFTRQGFFLWALGLGERIAALSQPEAITTPDDLNGALARRDALRTLITPEGMGEFGVLLQGKNLAQVPPLRGFSMPG